MTNEVTEFSMDVIGIIRLLHDLKPKTISGNKAKEEFLRRGNLTSETRKDFMENTYNVEEVETLKENEAKYIQEKAELFVKVLTKMREDNLVNDFLYIITLQSVYHVGTDSDFILRLQERMAGRLDCYMNKDQVEWFLSHMGQFRLKGYKPKDNGDGQYRASDYKDHDPVYFSVFDSILHEHDAEHRKRFDPTIKDSYFDNAETGYYSIFTREYRLPRLSNKEMMIRIGNIDKTVLPIFNVIES